MSAILLPWVLRPCTGTESAATRVTAPPAVTSMTSSASTTSSAATSGALFPPLGIAMFPIPPRFCSGNSEMGVRLPRPSSLTVSTLASRRMRSMPATSSSPLRDIPFTPLAVRPTMLIWSSAKWMARPPRDSSMISAVPSERATSMMASPSFTPAAMIPPARGLENSESSVRFMIPFRERKTR